jgi:hypothetical protein
MPIPRTLTSWLAAGLLAGISLAPRVQATPFIDGSFSVTGGFACTSCLGAGTDHIVSRLTLIEAASPARASAGTGAFAGFADTAVVPLAAVSLLEPPPVAGRFEVGGFTLSVLSVRDIMSRGLTCIGGICQDTLRFRFRGEVSGPGYRTTALAGIWTGQGSCLGGAGRVCLSPPSASWSASLSAIPAAEPRGLALLALGLLGVAAARHRRPRLRGTPLTRAAWG